MRDVAPETDPPLWDPNVGHQNSGSAPPPLVVKCTPLSLWESPVTPLMTSLL